jgi:hypothetical protein
MIAITGSVEFEGSLDDCMENDPIGRSVTPTERLYSDAVLRRSTFRFLASAAMEFIRRLECFSLRPPRISHPPSPHGQCFVRLKSPSLAPRLPAGVSPLRKLSDSVSRLTQFVGDAGLSVPGVDDASISENKLRQRRVDSCFGGDEQGQFAF